MPLEPNGERWNSFVTKRSASQFRITKLNALPTHTTSPRAPPTCTASKHSLDPLEPNPTYSLESTSLAPSALRSALSRSRSPRRYPSPTGIQTHFYLNPRASFIAIPRAKFKSNALRQFTRFRVRAPLRARRTARFELSLTVPATVSGALDVDLEVASSLAPSRAYGATRRARCRGCSRFQLDWLVR